MTATSGWDALCDTCPTTVGEDYGELIYVHQEFGLDEAGAQQWAVEHRAANPDHQVTVYRIMRSTMTLLDVHPNLAALLTGEEPVTEEGEHHPECGRISVPDVMMFCPTCQQPMTWCGCRFRCTADACVKP